MNNIVLYSFLLSLVLFSCKEVPQKVKLSDVDVNGFLTKMEKYKNNKVVIVNFWATWCQPCVEEFPDFVSLRNRYKKNLEVLFLSFDFAEKKSKVVEFLKKQNVGWEAYFNTSKMEEFFSKMPSSFSGALPFTFIVDTEGVIVETFKGKQSKKVLEPIIKKYINS